MTYTPDELDIFQEIRFAADMGDSSFVTNEEIELWINESISLVSVFPRRWPIEAIRRYAILYSVKNCLEKEELNVKPILEDMSAIIKQQTKLRDWS